MNTVILKILSLLGIVVVLGLLLPWGPLNYIWFAEQEEGDAQAVGGIVAILGIFTGLSIVFFRIFMSLFHGEEDIDFEEDED